jgi:hypothetical protein
MEGDVPMFAVMVIATAGVFTRPNAGPDDTSRCDPLSQQF